MFYQGEKALLSLADGTIIEGNSFGASTSVSGEVVFNTGMVGYPEALTDPSYRGQILVLTYPLVGNYGVPNENTKDNLGLPLYYESSEIHITGLIVSEYSWEHSHWAAQKSLGDWLSENGIPAVYGVDTRELTKQLREFGSILGRIDIVSVNINYIYPLLCLFTSTVGSTVLLFHEFHRDTTCLFLNLYQKIFSKTPTDAILWLKCQQRK